MNFDNFAFWLQGFFEISNAKTLDEAQVKIIKDHLGLCFKKVTPQRYPPNPPLGQIFPVFETPAPQIDRSQVTYCASNIPAYTGEPYLVSDKEQQDFIKSMRGLIEDPMQGQGPNGSDSFAPVLEVLDQRLC